MCSLSRTPEESKLLATWLQDLQKAYLGKFGDSPQTRRKFSAFKRWIKRGGGWMFWMEYSFNELYQDIAMFGRDVE